MKIVIFISPFLSSCRIAMKRSFQENIWCSGGLSIIVESVNNSKKSRTRKDQTTRQKSNDFFLIFSSFLFSFFLTCWKREVWPRGFQHTGNCFFEFPRGEIPEAIRRSNSRGKIPEAIPRSHSRGKIPEAIPRSNSRGNNIPEAVPRFLLRGKKEKKRNTVIRSAAVRSFLLCFCLVLVSKCGVAKNR